MLFFLLCASHVAARKITQQPEDLYAWPKYRVSFLNGLPLLNQTAQKWLSEGLVGGEREFLELQWDQKSPHFKSIGGGGEGASTSSDGDTLNTDAGVEQPRPSPSTPPRLQHMRLGGRANEFLCLVVPAPEVPSYVEDTQPPAPTRSWELLQPLHDTCIYHRQGWFSYAYCHNRYVKQFREKEPNLPLGLKEPEEDPNEDYYMLGHAPISETDDEAPGDLSLTSNTAVANRVELARGAGHRYLIQRWGDGTVCDKTGRKREIEVQFHCSMTSTDSIFFIKETRTCQYTLVIHTPRLCGEPGFKSPREDIEDTPIRCRKIVSSPAELEAADPSLPEAGSPFARQPPKPLPAPKPRSTNKAQGKASSTGGKTGGSSTKDGPEIHVVGGNGKIGETQEQLIKLAIETLLNRGNGEAAGGEGGGLNQARIALENGAAQVVTFGIDERGLFMEEVYDGEDAARGAAGGQGEAARGGARQPNAPRNQPRQQQQQGAPRQAPQQQQQQQQQQQTKGQPLSKTEKKKKKQAKKEEKEDEDEDELRLPLEIQLGDDEDAESLIELLRLAGYDVDLAELDEDGSDYKVTEYRFSSDDQYDDKDEGGEEYEGDLRQAGGQREEEPLPNHDEL